MALTQITTDGIKDGTITGTDLATNVDLVDNQKLRLGTGNDLQIYHDGSHSIIDNNTGILYLQTDQLNINNSASNEALAKFYANGAVELYHDNSKKFETTSAGATVTGALTVSSGGSFGSGVTFTGANYNAYWLHVANEFRFFDNAIAGFGTGSDLQIYHDGNNSYIRENGTGSLYIDSNGNGVVLRGVQGEDSIVCNANGDVELYYDNSKKFETTSIGATVSGRLDTQGLFTGDNNKILVGNSDDLQIYHDGSHSYIQDAGTGVLHIATSDLQVVNAGLSEFMLKANQDGAVELYFDGGKKFETTSGGIGVSGFLDIPSDSNRLRLGASNDLQIYHNGTTNYIEAVSGNLELIGNSSEKFALFVQNGAVVLYHNNVSKFETTSGGASVNGFLNVSTGIHIPDGGNSDNSITIGSSNDFRLYHDGSNSYILNATGALRVYNHVLEVKNDAGNETILKGSANGSVELYHNNVKRFETTSAGASVNGVFYIGPPAGADKDLVINKEGTGTLVRFRTTGTTRGTITSNGSTVAYNTSHSDKSMKKNFENWTEDTLALFKNINPQRFNFLNQEDETEKEKGFIAQDLVASFPEAYQKNDDDKYMFNPGGMVVYLMKAIQELEAEVAALKAS